MGKAKIASKNNPAGRERAKEYLYNNKKIKPVKLITANRTYFAAEYDGSGDLVVDGSGNPMPWAAAKLGG